MVHNVVILMNITPHRLAVEPFLERHGLQATMIAPTKIIAGVGASLGMTVLQVCLFYLYGSRFP